MGIGTFDVVDTRVADLDGLLSNKYRGAVVISLLEEDEWIPTSAVHLRGTVDEIEEELKRIHLPKLEEAGYIEWDRESEEVSRGPRFEEIERYLGSNKRDETLLLQD